MGGRNLYAPSWSWAASDRAVRWPPYLERCSKPKPSCEVISVEVDLVSANAPFRDVSAGTLKLSGRLKKATCVWSEENRLFDNQDPEKEITGYYFSLKTDGHNEQSKILVHCFEIYIKVSCTIPSRYYNTIASLGSLKPPGARAWNTRFGSYFSDTSSIFFTLCSP